MAKQRPENPLTATFEHITYARNKQGHVIVTSISADELERAWTPISKKEYDALVAQHAADMDAHNADYESFMKSKQADKDAVRKSVAAELGLSPDEVAVLLG